MLFYPVEDSRGVLINTAYGSDESDVNSVHSTDHGAEDTKHLESQKRKNKCRGNADNMLRDRES